MVVVIGCGGEVLMWRRLDLLCLGGGGEAVVAEVGVVLLLFRCCLVLVGFV
jgi:hypothetical protein